MADTTQEDFAITAATPSFSVTWMMAPTGYANAVVGAECLQSCSTVDEVAEASCYPTGGIDNLFSSMATMTAGDEAEYTSMWSEINDRYFTMLDCLCQQDLVAPWVSGSVSGVCDEECATETNTASLTAAAEEFSSLCSLVSVNAAAVATDDATSDDETTETTGSGSADSTSMDEEASASGTGDAGGEGSATGVKISGALLFGLLGLGLML